MYTFFANIIFVHNLTTASMLKMFASINICHSWYTTEKLNYTNRETIHFHYGLAVSHGEF